MKQAVFEISNRAHLARRIIQRYKKMTEPEAESMIDFVMRVLQGNTPPDWRFTDSPSSRFFIVHEGTNAKFMGLSYREREGGEKRGREVVLSLQQRLNDTRNISACIDCFVDKYIDDVLDPGLGIVHTIPTVYGVGKEAHIKEERKLYARAREELCHTIPMLSHKIASRPNAIVAADGTLWVRQHLNWMNMDPNGKEYYLFQPLARDGVDKCRFAIFMYFNDGQLGRVGTEQKFYCEGLVEALRETKMLIAGNNPVHSESYWKVPTYLDRRLIDLDFKERYSRSGPKKGEPVEEESFISPSETFELSFLREIVERARSRLHK